MSSAQVFRPPLPVLCDRCGLLIQAGSKALIACDGDKARITHLRCPGASAHHLPRRTPRLPEPLPANA